MNGYNEGIDGNLYNPSRVVPICEGIKHKVHKIATGSRKKMRIKLQREKSATAKCYSLEEKLVAQLAVRESVKQPKKQREKKKEQKI